MNAASCDDVAPARANGIYARRNIAFPDRFSHFEEIMESAPCLLCQGFGKLPMLVLQSVERGYAFIAIRVDDNEITRDPDAYIIAVILEP